MLVSLITIHGGAVFYLSGALHFANPEEYRALHDAMAILSEAYREARETRSNFHLTTKYLWCELNGEFLISSKEESNGVAR